MKKIITTVGTSLFTNLLKDDQNYKNLKDKPHKDWDSNSSYIDELRKKISSKTKNETDSAELQSLAKIRTKIQGDVEVFLIATDTILSRLACEVLKEKIPSILNNNIEVSFNPQLDVVSELQVKDREKFQKEGLVNLLNRIEKIASGYWENLIFNITGGYKAVIPYLTILAQVHSVVSYYTFQDSDEDKFELLEIPNLPLSIKEELFNQYWEEFAKLESENTISKDNFQFQFLQDANSCLEVVENFVSLNPLGLFLWRKYKEKFFIFYSPDDVWKEIQKQSDVQRIIKEKFTNENSLQSKTEQKGKHLVFDDGNNSNRIFYFKDKEKIYIYKTFDKQHDEYERFIQSALDKPNILKTSKPRKLER